MTTITNDITEAIKKNLSAEVSATLQSVLVQAKEDTAEVVRLNAKVASVSGELGAAQAANTRHLTTIAAHDALGVREAAVLKREQDIEVRELRQEVAAEKRVSAFAVDVVTKLVRNTEFRETVNRKETTPIATHYNSSGQSGSSVQTYEHGTNVTQTKEAT